MRIQQVVTFVVLNLLVGTALALPGAFEATYTVSKSGLTLGDMNVTLSHQNGVYRYYKTSRARGLASIFSGDKIVENVVGKYQGNNLQPTNYLYHHTNNRKDRKDQFQFIGPTRVKGSYKDSAYDLEVPVGTIDRASLELALARDLSANKKDLAYMLVEKGKLKDYVVKRLGDETIVINNKKYQTTKLTIERDNTNRETVFWLAKEIDYMPVKIEHIEKGTPVQTELKSFTRR